jgi:PAS domain S-box-containing protein
MLARLESQLETERRLRQATDKLHDEQARTRRYREEIVSLRAQLEAERAQYAEIFDFAPVGYLLLDAAGVMESCSLAAARLLGVERHYLIGMPLMTRIAKPDRRRFLDHLRHCRMTHDAVSVELHVLTPAGQETHVQLVSKRGGTAESMTAMLSAMIDLTERDRRLADHAIAEQERLDIEHANDISRAEIAAKDRFIAVLSHELRNPLTPILLTIETLERGLLAPERIAGALALIRRNVDAEVRLIVDLLDVSRITHGKLRLDRRPVDLHEILVDVVSGAAAEIDRARLTVDRVLEATRYQLDADPVRLRQVIWNLLVNAIRNTPPGGRIQVRTADVDDRILLVVTDTGAGIAPDKLEQIFQPFEQSDEPGQRARAGLGLGLAICRGLVEAHGGQITAASKGLGSGATFFVELPTITATFIGLPAPTGVTAPSRRLRVLVVEDDTDAAAAISAVLRLRGHDVTVAGSVREALACGTTSLDVLVSDISLPDGNGASLMRQLRRRHPLRGIAVSGFGTPADVRRSVAAGFERHVTKPIRMADLLDFVEDRRA